MASERLSIGFSASTDYPHADLVGACTVFNIGGNKYRLVTAIIYGIWRVYVRNLLTHLEYSRNTWKRDCGE